MRGGPSLKVKGGLVGFRKDSSEEERLHPPPSEEEGALGKRWSSLWKGRRRDSKRCGGPSLKGKSCANERNESSLSNCRVQPVLSIMGDGGIRKSLP